MFGSPIEGINEYERLNNLPPNFINIFIVSTKENAFKRLERGRLSIPEFLKQVKKELDDASAIDVYIEYMKRKKNANLNRNDFPQNGYDIDTVDVFSKMNSFGAKVHKQMIHCLFMLRCSGYLTVALTNNFVAMTADKKSALSPFFDDILESAVIGERKPNPKIFEFALQRIKRRKEGVVAFENVIFLDDIGLNVKSAMKLGIKTIKVRMNQQNKAISDLEKILNFKENSLLPPSTAFKCRLNGNGTQCVFHGVAADPIVVALDGCLGNDDLPFLTETGFFVIEARRDGLDELID